MELREFKLIRTRVLALEYTGPEMNDQIMKQFPGNFVRGWFRKHAYALLPEVHGLDIPHAGDWLVFDLDGKTLIDVLNPTLFKATYRPVEGEENA